MFLALGFSEQEHKIYLVLLQNGALTVAQIAKMTQLHRPTVYQLLPNLLDRQLISSVERGKRTVYMAESPEKLQHAFQVLADQFQEAIPELQMMYQKKSSQPIAKFFEGKKGISFVFEDIVQSLKKGDVFYRYSSRAKGVNTESYLPKNYRALRDAKQLERFVITNEETAEKKKKRLERATKIIPKEFGLFDYNITELIYGNKVAFLDYNTETAFLIENSVIADFQKKLFKVLYAKLDAQKEKHP